MGPLEGIKVVEIIGLGPGPFAGMLFADMGAEVVAIDRPGPKALGELKPDINRRGKTVVTLDLKSKSGRDRVLDLVADADALIEGARPGVMERLGLGPADCFTVNPKLVYGRITGWGQDGPLSRAAGHDLNYIALSGALYSMGASAGPPPVPLNLVGDFGGGAMFLAFGVVCALLEAKNSGRGQVVDASMVEGASLMMSIFHSLRANGLWNDERGRNFLDGGAHFYSVFETKDGKYVSLGAIEGRFARDFIQRVGLDNKWLVNHMNPDAWPELKDELSALFRQKTRDEWCALLEGTDSCFAPVLPFWEAHAHPHNRQRRSFIELEGVIQPGPAPKFSRTNPEVAGARALEGDRKDDDDSPRSKKQI